MYMYMYMAHTSYHKYTLLPNNGRFWLLTLVHKTTVYIFATTRTEITHGPTSSMATAMKATIYIAAKTHLSMP